MLTVHRQRILLNEITFLRSEKVTRQASFVTLSSALYDGMAGLILYGTTFVLNYIVSYTNVIVWLLYHQ